MTPSSRGPWARFGLGAGVLLLALAAFLPVQAIVRSLATRYRTVAGFREDYVRGLQTARIALAANGLFLLALPWLLGRCRLEPAKASLPRREAAGAGALYGLAMLAALPGLFESFQDDEWRVLEQYIRHGPMVILTRSLEADSHLLQSLLSWPFVALFGMGEIPVRLPSFLLSPLAPAFLFLLLRRDHSAGRSWLAALPLAGAPFLCQYAAEGRGYGPLISTVIGLAWLHAPMAEGKRPAWIAYGAAGFAAVSLHPFGAAAVVALGAAPFILRRGRASEVRFRCGTATIAIGVASFLFYALTLPQYFDYSAGVKALPPGIRPSPWMLAGDLFVPTLSPVLILPFLAAGIVGIVRRKCPADLGGALILCTVLLALMPLLSGSDSSPRFYAPAFALAWIPIGAGLAAALSTPRTGAALWAATVLATASADVGYGRIGRRDYRAAAREVLARKSPGERLVVRFDGRPMTPYWPEPLTVARDEELLTLAPDWFVGVDANLLPSPTVSAWIAEGYQEVFRLPSVRGTLVGYRRR